MRLLQANLVVISCLVGSVSAAEVETAPREEKHYVEIPFGARGATPPAASSITPSSQPAVESTPEIDSLIRQLGDADFRNREAAAARLKEIGPPALPALRQARDGGGDPEVVSRADAVIRFFERPPVPGRLPSSGSFVSTRRRGTGNFNLRFSVENGNNIVEVREPGRTVRIEHGQGGIEMSVTGMEDGKEVTRDYQARTPEELARQHPEAFEMFQRWTGQAAQRGMEREQRALRRHEEMLERRGGVQLLPLVPPARPPRVIPPAIDDVRELRDRIRRQHNLPGDAAADFDAQQREMQRFLERLAQERLEIRQQADAIEKRVRETERRAAGALEEKSK